MNSRSGFRSDFVISDGCPNIGEGTRHHISLKGPEEWVIGTAGTHGPPPEGPQDRRRRKPPVGKGSERPAGAERPPRKQPPGRLTPLAGNAESDTVTPKLGIHRAAGADLTQRPGRAMIPVV